MAALLGVFVAPVTLPIQKAHAQKVARAKPNLVSKKHKFAMYAPVKPVIRSRPLSSNSAGTVTIFAMRARPVVYSAIVVTLSPIEDDMARANFFDMMQEIFKSNANLPEGVSNVRLLASRDAVINGRRTRELVLSCTLRPAGSSQAVEGHIQALIFKEGPRIYLFSGAVATAQRAQYRSQIHRVLGSVRVYP